MYGNDDLIYFLESVENDFFSNKLSKDYYFNGEKILKGTKIVKAFKYFESNPKILAELQNQASMIIQEDKVSGILCMSVHPLDYLSSSENTYHWRSCHALDGDYRSGNLSYMLDKSTVVCYLKKANEICKLPNFPEDVLWNSKKWRMLLFLEDNREALFAGRQYPFFSPGALHHVMNLYVDKFHSSPAHWSNWYNDYISEFARSDNSCPRRDMWLLGRHVCLKGVIYSMEDLITDAKHSQHFNDLKYSSFYIPYYCWHYYPKNDHKRLHFSIGAEVPCIRCEHKYIDVDASMMCIHCEAEHGSGEDENFVYCACCERRVPRVESQWMETIGDYICDECRERETTECQGCGELFYNCEIKYSREHEKYLCPYCMELRAREDNWVKQTPIIPIEFPWDDDLPF